MTKEKELLELITELERNDPTFEHLIDVLIQLLNILRARGKRYNGHSSSAYEQMFDNGDDVCAFYNVRRAFIRMKEAKGRYKEDIPDKAILDNLLDLTNYGICWLCCRRERDKKKRGAQWPNNGVKLNSLN